MEKLIIFVKAPRPGFVKNRLAVSLGPDAAADAYRTLVESLLRNLSAAPRPRGFEGNRPQTVATPFGRTQPVELRFTPDDAITEVKQWLRPNWTASPQGAGDLGDRMHRAFLHAFGAGAGRVAIIGSDCPTITPTDIGEAWQALASHDLVLGPATDGGYWLIGLTCPCPALFEGIQWSTKQVWAQTLARAARLRLRVHVLAQHTDIDTEPDWVAFTRTGRST